MALGKVSRSSSLKLNNDDKQLRLQLVRCNSGLGRKRIELSKEKDQAFPFDSPTKLPLLKRHRSERLNNMMMMIDGDGDGDDDDDDDRNEKSVLESLPQDVLIRILCGVEHEDLNQLFNVSKSIRASTVIAKRMHFAYSTPIKTKSFRTSIEFEEPSELDAIEEAPNAPRQSRSYRSINRKRLADISVALFT